MGDELALIWNKQEIQQIPPPPHTRTHCQFTRNKWMNYWLSGLSWLYYYVRWKEKGLFWSPADDIQRNKNVLLDWSCSAQASHDQMTIWRNEGGNPTCWICLPAVFVSFQFAPVICGGSQQRLMELPGRRHRSSAMLHWLQALSSFLVKLLCSLMDHKWILAWFKVTRAMMVVGPIAVVTLSKITEMLSFAQTHPNLSCFSGKHWTKVQCGELRKIQNLSSKNQI